MTELTWDKEKTGELSPLEKDSIIKRINDRNATSQCELCGTKKWIIGDFLSSYATIARVDGGVIMPSSDPIPTSVLLFCSNCGNTKALNINILGLGDDLARPSVGGKK